MNGLRYALPAVMAFAALSACSGGGPSSTSGFLPQKAPASTTNRTTQTLTSEHFLYVAAFDRVDLFELPVTNSSTPYATLNPPFGDARDVKVENNDIDVADSTFGNNRIATYDLVPTAIGVTFSFDCTFGFPENFAEAIHNDHLYVVQQYGGIDGATIRPDVPTSQFLVEFKEDTPCPPGTILAYTSNGLDVPRGVAANDQYIFVANSNGENIATFSQPLHTGDAPITITPVGSGVTNLVANSTALYVMSFNGGLLRYNLPLTSTSTPTASVTLPCGNNSAPYGVEDKDPYIYVSDAGCSTVYLYHKPIHTGDSPVVTLHDPNGATGIDVH